jgi:hypothetical protein
MLQFEVPASTLSTALAVYEISPERAVDLWQALDDAAGATQALELSAANLSEAPVTATMAIDAEAPLSVEGGPRELTIPARETASLELPVQGAEDLQQPTLVTVRTVWPGGERESIAQMRPLVLNPSLTIDQEANGTPDYWVAAGTDSGFARGIEDGGAWIQGQPKEFQFFRQDVPLQRNTQYTFSAEIRRTEGEGNIYAAVIEHLEGRGLRVHDIGQDGSAGEWERFETTFTTGEDFESVKIYLYNTHSEARAWFRDLRLTQN